MDNSDGSLFTRALKTVETFSEKNVAVLPETPSVELLSYLAAVTGQDAQMIARLYEVIINAARLDKYTQDTLSGQIGFAED